MASGHVCRVPGSEARQLGCDGCTSLASARQRADRAPGHQDEERHRAADLWRDEDWVSAQQIGKPIDPRADYAEWKALLDAAEVREARLHDARHTAATILLLLGINDRLAMDVMGWSQASMKLRYMHVSDAMRDKIAEQVGGLLWTEGDDDEGALTGPWSRHSRSPDIRLRPTPSELLGGPPASTSIDRTPAR